MLLNGCRHVGHRHERTKRHLTCVVHDFVSEDTGSYLGSASVAADQDIACKCVPVRELRCETLGALRESLKAMIEEHAIRIVLTHGGSQCNLKVDSVDLVVSSTESLHIVVSRSDFQHFAGLKVAADKRPGWTSLFGNSAPEPVRIHARDSRNVAARE